jgi:NADH:ubiquinone oxidoreductase subunit C
MTAVGWLPAPAEDLFGPEATAEESYEVLTVDVPPTSWIAALTAARDDLGCTYFDWLSAVDEPGTGFRVAAHVAALSPVRRLLIRTTVPHEAPTLPTAVDVYAGAAWHERETHEMFGVAFEGHPSLDHLLLPEGFEGHPLRKDFVLAARVAKAWPGAKEPGEPAAGAAHGAPKRRQMLPPGVPDPNEWGPLKGQLPPAPARPARGAARSAAGERPARAAGERPARAAGERPVRRTRSAAEGSASQAGAAPAAEATSTEGAAADGSVRPAGVSAETDAGAAAARPRRSRTAAEGSASQTTPGAESPTGEGAAAPEAVDSPPTTPGTPSGQRRARSADEGSASQRAEAGTSPSGPRRSRSASQGSASQRAASEAATPTEAEGVAVTPPPLASAPKPPTAPRSPDAPWHHARPAFENPETERRAGDESETGAPAERPEKPTEQQPTPAAPSASERKPAAADAAQAPASETERTSEAGRTPEAERTSEAERAPEAERTPDTRRAPEADASPENPSPEDRSPEDRSPEDPTGGPQ